MENDAVNTWLVVSTLIVVVCLGSVVAYAVLQAPAVPGEPPQTGQPTSPGENYTAPTLTYIKTHDMAVGTHRPEILVKGENIYLIVVEPESDVKHKGYIFDASNPSNVDFSNPVSSFVVSRITDEYGEGSDHRATIIGNELVVVYQTLVITQGGGEGPAEQYADSQSLMLSRFTLDGENKFTTELVHSTDFANDSFPDMCILPYSNHLLVSTGSMGTRFKIREVGLDGSILNTHEYTTSTTTVSSPIGNSMVWGENEQLLMFSGLHTGDSGDLTATKIDKQFNLGATKAFDLGQEETFPTGVLYHDGFYFVGYISREKWSADLESNPYSPALLILDRDLNVVDNFLVSQKPGSGHVHPMLAILENRLFYAWSESVPVGDHSAPQVHIEEYLIS